METVIVSEVERRGRMRAAVPAGSTRRKSRNIGMPGPESQNHTTLSRPDGGGGVAFFFINSHRPEFAQHLPFRFSYTKM